MERNLPIIGPPRHVRHCAFWPFTYMFSFDFHHELVIPELLSLFLILNFRTDE